MNKFKTRFAHALLLCALLVSPALAKVKSQVITIGQDFTVGGTALKAGTYRFSFDTEAKELSVSDKKTKQVVAKVSARAEARQGTSLRLDIRLAEGGGAALLSVAFPNEKQAFVASDSTGAR